VGFISFYRVYRYALKDEEYCDKHIYFKRDRSLKIQKKQSQHYDKKLVVNILRAKKVVQELAYCNKFDLFCTFTVDGEKSDRYDLTGCRKRLSQLFNNYKKRYSPGFKYLIIPEFHSDGAIHFHGLIAGIREGDLIVPDKIPKRNVFTGELEQIPNTKQYRDWPYYSGKMGYFSCSAIKNHEAVSRYIIKYLTKDLEKLPRGQQAYLCSKGLNRAELVFDCDDVPMVGEPEWQDDFIGIQWHNRDNLFDVYGIIDSVCSDLHTIDEIKKVEYEQLKIDE
jgi:hypothetical protein